MTVGDDLLQTQLDSGAVLNEAAGITICCAPRVAHFGSAVEEINNAVESSAVFDVSDRVQIELRGKDARPFLHNFCTNDVKRLQPGEGCEAFVTSVKGRILAHVFVFATEESVWIDSPQTDEGRLMAHFDRYLFSEDVQLVGHTDEFGELCVSGKECFARLTNAGLAVSDIDQLQHSTGLIDDIAVVARRADLWDCPGILISARREDLRRLWQHVVAADIQPAGSQAFHSLRIEAKFPIYGIDLSEDNLAQEANRTSQAISFTKGCYLGQEPIARLDALGHVNRQVTRLHLQTERPLSDTALAISDDGKEIGVITSAVITPGQPLTVALGMLRKSYSQPGTQLSVRSGDDEISATVR